LVDDRRGRRRAAGHGGSELRGRRVLRRQIERLDGDGHHGIDDDYNDGDEHRLDIIQRPVEPELEQRSVFDVDVDQWQ